MRVANSVRDAVVVGFLETVEGFWFHFRGMTDGHGEIVPTTVCRIGELLRGGADQARGALKACLLKGSVVFCTMQYGGRECKLYYVCRDSLNPDYTPEDASREFKNRQPRQGCFPIVTALVLLGSIFLAAAAICACR